MLDINETTVRLTNEDRAKKADAYKRIIDKTFPTAAKLNALRAKVSKKELIRIDTMEFLHNICYDVQEEALLGHGKLDVYFTDIKIKHIHTAYPFSRYDELDWDEIIRFLKSQGYTTNIRTEDHQQHGPLVSTYRVFTISWA